MSKKLPIEPDNFFDRRATRSMMMLGQGRCFPLFGRGDRHKRVRIALSLVKHIKNLIERKVMQSARRAIDKNLEYLLYREKEQGLKVGTILLQVWSVRISSFTNTNESKLVWIPRGQENPNQLLRKKRK
ncbi:hypothetical protein ACE6H2_020651 [Prunus campanulata]